QRPAFIPEGANVKIKGDPNDPNRRKLEREIEAENGGAGVYNVDLQKWYQLRDPAWRYDYVPEILDGKNVADFVDADIEARLEALEREEERLVAEGFYEEADPLEDMDLDEEAEEVLREAAKEVEGKRAILVHDSRVKKGKSSRPLSVKAKGMRKSFHDMSASLAEKGIAVDASRARARSVDRKRARSQSRGRSIDDSKWLVSAATSAAAARSQSRGVGASLAREQSVAAKRVRLDISMSRNRSLAGIKNVDQRVDSEKMHSFAQRPRNNQAKASDADRRILNLRPKHLLSGKRGLGTANHR
ncbi:Nucleolar GTP-binding protein 1, partial [Cladochytrium tenue]